MGDACAHLAGEIQTKVVDIGDNHVPRASVAGDRDGHDADRSGAGDQYVLTNQVERQGSVSCVTQRIQNRGDIVADRVWQLENVLCGDA
ncbi:hypothetical protein MnTg04_01508 [bacterium MnTg04]|nr:hypothetical protein MnTg04_01508 [bacterium MnTg04]